MATPRKSDEKYPGYLADQDRKPSKLTAREEELLTRTLHPDDFAETIDVIASRLETLEVRFNEAMQTLFVQLANSSFLLLKIDEAEK